MPHFFARRIRHDIFPSKPTMNRFVKIGVLMAWAIQVQQVFGQVVQGQIEEPGVAGKFLMLRQARGAEMIPFDSTRIGEDGTFRFGTPCQATGFYQLAVNDSDAVNIVLDKREPLVDLHFLRLPLEDHMEVVASLENQRMAELQYVTAETNAIQASVKQQRGLLQGGDTLQLRALDRLEYKATETLKEYWDSLAADSAISYFARSFTVNRALDGTRNKGPMAVAAVFDFSDPELMRSTLYDGAVMAFFQNLNIVAESQFMLASDTLMMLAGRHAETKAYMLEHLIDLFSTYGPEMALQYLIDKQIDQIGDLEEMPPRLRDKVEGLMAVSIGRVAPDVELNDHGTIKQLAQIVKANRYTALFFYSSTCDHCHAQMPGLKSDQERFGARGFDVIGIALDADSAEFKRSIEENAIPWKCYSEFNGWGSTPAKLFKVNGTPSFFLLDRHMTIVAKPRDAQGLGEVLEQLYNSNGKQ